MILAVLDSVYTMCITNVTPIENSQNTKSFQKEK